MNGDRGGPALLVLACSGRKSAHVRRGRAWDVYDGRVYQVLKKALRDHPGWETAIEVLIISARHGVISAWGEIETYDDRLTAAKASELAGCSMRQLRSLLVGRAFRAAHATLGRAYRTAVPDLAALVAPAPIEWASGGIGARNAATRAWVLQRLAEAGFGVTGGTARRPSHRR